MRDEGLAMTEAWLALQREFTELELQRGWKALFFCMWHSDKPHVRPLLLLRPPPDPSRSSTSSPSA